jgi:hypothetical protein
MSIDSIPNPKGDRVDCFCCPKLQQQLTVFSLPPDLKLVNSDHYLVVYSYKMMGCVKKNFELL